MFLALNLILAKKQKFGECQYINGRNKTNIKNQTYYFYSDILDLDEFDGSKIKVDKNNFNDIDIYNLGCEHKKKITEYNEINSVNPLYLRIKDMKGQFKKRKGDNV